MSATSAEAIDSGEPWRPVPSRSARPPAGTFDLVVVGAGFAGLACAKRAAPRGLRVLVIDQQAAPGQHVHTTGILVKEAQAEWPAPARIIRRLGRVRVYAPSHRCAELACDGFFFRHRHRGTVGLPPGRGTPCGCGGSVRLSVPGFRVNHYPGHAGWLRGGLSLPGRCGWRSFQGREVCGARPQ